MSRILIYEPRRRSTDWSTTLAAEGHEVVLCNGREELLDAFAARRPDAMIYVLADLPFDLGVLSVVRRMAATLPIILLGGPAGLETRRSVQELRPTYYGMFPLETAEVSEALRGALEHRNGGRLAS